MDYGNALASGVLLAAGLVCVLPDAVEALPKGIAMVWAGSAVLSLVMVEELAAMASLLLADAPLSKAVPSEWPSANPQSNGVPPDCESATRVCSCSRGLLEFVAQDNNWFCSDCEREVQSGEHMFGCSACNYDKCRTCVNMGYEKLTGKSPANGELVRRVGRLTNMVNPGKRPFKTIDNIDTCQKHCDTDCYRLIEVEPLNLVLNVKSELSPHKAICLFAALSFHSVMEGLGLGSQQKAVQLAALMTVILAHKSIAAFALGSSIVRANISPWRMAIMSVVFSIATPCGIMLGMWAERNFKADSLAIFNAIAAGTFIQVSLMELMPAALQREKEDCSGLSRAFRCIGIITGFTAMTFTVLILG